MLTSEECFVVAEAAKNYPQGYGFVWVATEKVITLDEAVLPKMRKVACEFG